jgi:hypothetical protein
MPSSLTAIKKIPYPGVQSQHSQPHPGYSKPHRINLREGGKQGQGSKEITEIIPIDTKKI